MLQQTIHQFERLKQATYDTALQCSAPRCAAHAVDAISHGALREERWGVAQLKRGENLDK